MGKPGNERIVVLAGNQSFWIMLADFSATLSGTATTHTLEYVVFDKINKYLAMGHPTDCVDVTAWQSFVRLPDC